MGDGEEPVKLWKEAVDDVLGTCLAHTNVWLIQDKIVSEEITKRSGELFKEYFCQYISSTPLNSGLNAIKRAIDTWHAYKFEEEQRVLRRKKNTKKKTKREAKRKAKSPPPIP